MEGCIPVCKQMAMRARERKQLMAAFLNQLTVLSLQGFVSEQCEKQCQC